MVMTFVIMITFVVMIIIFDIFDKMLMLIIILFITLYDATLRKCNCVIKKKSFQSCPLRISNNIFRDYLESKVIM